MATADVVVVGGGIAGASLAWALAREGLGVTVLEATAEYPDRVRGECMVPWGFREARDLGVADVLLAAGAHVAPVWKQYTEGLEEVGELPMATLVPDIPGSLNLGHPRACQALVDAAAAQGAVVARGARNVRVSPGPPPRVSFTSDGHDEEISTTLIVGADGRASSVRRQAGIRLEHQAPIGYIAGLLVDGLDGIPAEQDVLVSEGDVFFVMFHQGGGRARAYLMTGLADQHRFAGANGAERFLAACDFASYAASDQLRAARPSGPCATYPGDDTWTDEPYVDGVVLIGDAAGYNDPIIGQGLSIAMRDARMVRDVVVDGGRTADAFAAYGLERRERMRRLRFIADVVAVEQVEQAPNRRARRLLVAERMGAMDPSMFPLLLGAFTGPEVVPAELFDDGLLQLIRAA